MDIRKLFLDYFSSKGHKIYPSSPLVPDDPTLLFTNAGMVQFKNIFTGKAPIPNPPRATSSQTCIRAGGKHNDLDNVGYTARHHTFFEMLGNFSFGDYFKEDAIKYAWEFVTSKDYLNLPKDRLWVTVHEKDDEAFEIWKKYIDESRIKRFGDKDNFWQMGDTGPCGPCSEIFYDQGEEHFNSPEDYLGGDGDRFLEIWNLVFMQYERDEEGNLHPLPKPSIDTGMGLERITAIKEGVYNNYDSSLFMPIIKKISEVVGFEPNDKNIASFRVIADHLRSTSFLLAQGVSFDKEGRGYVLRRILRRAIRHGYLLGMREPFIYKLVDTLVDIMGDHYDYLKKQKESIKSSMKVEEERFFETIENGIKLFNEELKRTKDIFSGEVAFKLYDTYGFPLDLTQDMLREKGIELDIRGFEEMMKRQKEKSRAAWKGSGDKAIDGDFKILEEKFGENEFVGYEDTQSNSKVLALLDEEFKIKDKIEGFGWVMLDKTPFYAESGGQVGDKGELIVENGGLNIKVLDTKKFNNLNLSFIDTQGEVLKVGDRVLAKVDPSRAEIAKHHSATHLLHAALRDILGDHITQAGSLVEANRLRFDFTHPKPLTKEELKKVERWVNEVIFRAIDAKVEEMDLEEAKKKGAIALFGEKYKNRVRVVEFEGASIELCGGTHVKNSSEISLFLITKESGVSSGVRRIEAVCSREAYKLIKKDQEEKEEALEVLKSKDLLLGIKKLKDELKKVKKELDSALSSSSKELNLIEIDGVKVIVDEIKGGDIKKIIDDIKNRYEKVAVMLFKKDDNKVTLAAGSKNSGVDASSWIKEIAPIIKGGGGGRSDFAQAGGKDISKVSEAIKRAKEWVENIIKGKE
ncbi:MAG: alanine--tRNA ligase [Epsilonproteobacteria bacterium]|nr:alanine--tRNA ligase [Campylobacterota bacterium]